MVTALVAASADRIERPAQPRQNRSIQVDTKEKDRAPRHAIMDVKIEPEEFDLIVVGTGLQESLIAG